MDGAQLTVLILSSTVVGAIATKLIEAAIAGITGAMRAKRDELDTIARERTAARRDADIEAARRRILQESLSEHRVLITEAPCLGAERLPPYPTLPHPD